MVGMANLGSQLYVFPFVIMATIKKRTCHGNTYVVKPKYITKKRSRCIVTRLLYVGCVVFFVSKKQGSKVRLALEYI